MARGHHMPFGSRSSTAELAALRSSARSMAAPWRAIQPMLMASVLSAWRNVRALFGSVLPLLPSNASTLPVVLGARAGSMCPGGRSSESS